MQEGENWSGGMRACDCGSEFQLQEEEESKHSHSQHNSPKPSQPATGKIQELKIIAAAGQIKAGNNISSVAFALRILFLSHH